MNDLNGSYFSIGGGGLHRLLPCGPQRSVREALLGGKHLFVGDEAVHYGGYAHAEYLAETEQRPPFVMNIWGITSQIKSKQIKTHHPIG